MHILSSWRNGKPHPLPPLTHLLATWQLPSHSTITDLLLSFIHLTQTQYAAPPGDHNHSWWCLNLTSWKQLLSLRVVTHEVLHHSSANRRHLKIGTTSLQCVHFPKWISKSVLYMEHRPGQMSGWRQVIRKSHEIWCFYNPSFVGPCVWFYNYKRKW